ncbi:MAG: TonB family protein [Chloroherpetonaceae bacterium]|nr:TonB family protein [Chloroherpetonaceae bacterium]
MKRQLIFSLLLGAAMFATEATANEKNSLKSGVINSEHAREGESTLAKNLRAKMSFPEVARRLGLQGSVLAELKINADGEINEVVILEPSQYAVFNESVRNELTGANVASFFSDDDMPKSVKIKFTYTKKSVRIESRGEEISAE